MTPFARPMLTVDLKAMCRNWQRVSKCFAGQVLGAVVKHDAYGLGMANVVPALVNAGCRHFWVDTPKRGLTVKAVLPDSVSQVQVLVLHGLSGMAMPDLATNGLIPVLNSLQEIEHAHSNALRYRTQYDVAIQLDTGLTRLGLREPDVHLLNQNPSLLDGLRVTDWVTQLSRFDAPMDAACVHQRDLFESWTARLPPARRSVATSAGVFAQRNLHFDHARVGSALYGVDTSLNHVQALEVVATLEAPVLHVISVPANTAIGYGGMFVTSRTSIIATVAAGYGDGLPASLAHGGRVAINGRLAPVVGGIAMGLLNVDVTDLPIECAKPGDSAQFYGSDLLLSDVATRACLPPAAILVPTAIKAERRYLTAQSADPTPGVETLA